MKTQIGFWPFFGIVLCGFYALGSLLFAGQINGQIKMAVESQTQSVEITPDACGGTALIYAK